jgi:signal transduction histidine kinase
VSALEQLVEGAASRTKTTIDMEGGAVGRLPPAVETVLYRITQEALANALRHAQAKRVRIRVWRDGSEVTLSVEDDGVGFDTQTCCQRGTGARPSGLGLVGIRERAESVGGVLALRSAPGQGLEVRVRIPV